MSKRSVVKVYMRIVSLAALYLCLAACGPSTAQDNRAQNPSPEKSTEKSTEKSAEEKWQWPAQDKTAEVSEAAKPLVAAARKRLDALVVYDGRYVGIDYPGGDVPATMGVCTDVVIRSLRKAYDFDLQVAVHEDMKANFRLYPTTWGHRGPDKNIDHRRVPNLEVYFARAGYEVPITQNPKDYLPGDIVAWRLDAGSGTGGPPHIGIVSDRLSREDTPLIIHNIGGGVEESDMLFRHRITGHYRYQADS